MKKKLKKIFSIRNISIFINVIYLIIVGILAFKLFKMDVLPNKYLVEGLIVLFLLLIVSLIINLKFNKKKKLMIVFDILNIIVISLSIFGLIKIVQTDDFLQKISNNKVEITNYYVIVGKNSKIKSVHDIRKKDVYVIDNESNGEKVINKLQEKVSVEIRSTEDVLELGSDLLADEVQIALLSDANYELLKENNEDFEKNTKIIYTISIESVLEDISKDVKVTEETFNIFISGIDTYGKISTKARSDVNMIMTVNPKSKKILLTSIPRDYYVQLHDTTGYKDKLTHAGVYGINKSVQTVEDLFNTDINYYLRVNFNTLIKVVNEIDGVEINSDRAFTPWVNQKCYIKKGIQTLKGDCALAYARERHAYMSGDRHRGENQQEVITAIINKMTTSKKTITNYSDILDALEGSFQTNMSSEEIYSLIKMQINDMTKWTIESQSVNGRDSSNYTYSYGSQKLYVMEPDMETVELAKTKIYELMDN